MKIPHWFAVAVMLVFVATACEAEISLDLVQPEDPAVSVEPAAPAVNPDLNAEAEEGAEVGPDESKPLQLALDLTDGSHIIGVPSARSVRILTSFADMDVSFTKISAIQIDHKTNAASVSFLNGDQLKGELDVKAIEVEVLFGKFSIALEHIVALYVLSDDLPLPANLREGLMLYYSFNSRGGAGSVSDKSGKGNHGKVQGAEWTAKGMHGGSYIFKGKDNEIIGSDLHLPSGDSSRSVSFWFKFNAASTENGGSFVTWGTGQNNQLSTIGFDRRVNRYGVCFSQWGAVDVSAKKITKADEWHHVVFVYTGSGRMQFYVDKVDSGLQADEITSPVNTVPSGQLRIGGGEFDGQIGEVMIYDRALSEQEIERINDLQKKSFTP